jgi:hypothetical protein
MIHLYDNLLNPSAYHGHHKKPPFFEGWYYKIVDPGETHRYAIIPGIFKSTDPRRQHAFVQILDGSNGQTIYQTYPTGEFWAAENRFELRIGPNTFSTNHVNVDIDHPELAMRGELNFEGITPWPVRLTSPGIMGWYAWVPYMETYHGVISLDHEIRGGLTIRGELVDFSGGRGYIEKDWGKSFPSAWVWMQSNHFSHPGTSLTASLAIIPWINWSFPGFIIGLWHEGCLHRFATYTGASIEQFDIRDNEIAWVIRDKPYHLEILASRSEGGLLQAPTLESMDRRIAESQTAAIEVKLTSNERGAKKVVFQGQGRIAALEAVGDLDRLTRMVRQKFGL